MPRPLPPVRGPALTAAAPVARPWAGAAALTVALLLAAASPPSQAKRQREKEETPASTTASAAPNPAIPSCAPPKCAVTVGGGQFLRDGKPWIPKGVVVTGLLAPKEYIKGTYANARAVWGETFLRQLQDAGADALRFNVSMAGLDPTNPMKDGRMTAAMKKAYLDDIVAAVALAERYGMASFVTLTNGEPTGFDTSEETPGPEAARAWAVLGPALANRPSVAFIAFNEPGFGGASTIDTQPEPWSRWRTSFQLMVDAIRKTGARNVIVLDGISTSRVWRKNTDANIPKDPVNQLAYDLHPFPTDGQLRHKGGSAKLDYYRPSDIDHWLDGWCDRHACLASAFFTGVSNNPQKANCYDSSNTPGGNGDSPRITQAFLNHFTKKKIGVMAFAGDWNFRVFDKPGRPGAQLTSFKGFTNCRSGEKSHGPGELLSQTWLEIGRAEGRR